MHGCMLAGHVFLLGVGVDFSHQLETVLASSYCPMITGLQKPWLLYGSQVPGWPVFVHSLT